MSMFNALIAGAVHRAGEQIKAYWQSIVRGFAEAGAAAVKLAPDAIAVVGGSLLSYGAGLVYRPAGFIVGGALLLAVGVIGSINAARTKASE
jgi:hypothetical protein